MFVYLIENDGLIKIINQLALIWSLESMSD